MVVGELFLSAFLQVLFDRLAPRARDLWNLARREGLEKKLEQLEKTFRTIEAVLADAEEKQLTVRAVKLWLDDLRDLAYDAEDVLDEFTTEALKQKVMAKRQASAGKLQNLDCACFSPTAIKFKVKMRSKIEAITSRLEAISQRKNQLCLVENVLEGASRSTNTFQITPTTSLPIEVVVYGRDKDRDNVIDMLLKDEPGDFNFHVISIVGMGGLGKTTLARHVYNDQAVRDFHTKAWVCVSNDLDVTRITKEILEAVTCQSFDLKGLDLIQGKLQEALALKKFLIVLDDVWDMEYAKWEALRSSLRFGAPGSKIIMTTRKRDVALKMKSVKPYELKLLSDDDCWSVFTKHAFENQNTTTHPNLELLHKMVVERCKGLPLAARTLGSILHYKPLDEWEDILNSKIWSLSEAESDIFPVLRLSYHHLSPELKRCFAYCAIFPQNYVFTEKELVHLWMGEGFIQQIEGKKQVNEIGSRNFRELVSRSIFQAVDNHKSHFFMHHLVHELAQWAAGETCFRLEDVFESNGQYKRIDRARHSSYGLGFYDGIKKFEVFHEVKCLRTFLPLSIRSYNGYLTNSVLFYLLPKLKKLRVLSFAGYNITELPDLIGDLKHLRYLNLSGTLIKGLPNSMCSLYNLQSLVLSHCSRLKTLPSNMENLVNLCHLDISHVYSLEAMPIGLKELKSLQTLSHFVLGKDNGCNIKELMNFRSLRGTIGISNLENVGDVMDAKVANLSEKYVDTVVLSWSPNFDDSRKVENDRCVLDVLRPHQNLKELTIKCYAGSGFSTWLGDPSFINIELLKLESCKRCKCLPPLGQLPSLKVLVIKGMAGVQSVGIEFFGSTYSKNPFPLLEVLSFDDMQGWEYWSGFEVNEHVKAFPRLRQLSIINCPMFLGNLPNNLVSLEKLVIRKCRRITCGNTSEFTKVEHLEIGGDGCEDLIRMDVSCTVRHLKLSDFGRLEKLPITLCSLMHLRELHVDGCSSLVSLPSAVLSSVVHEYVYISNCRNLRTLLDDGGCSSKSTVKRFTISTCPSLECFSSRAMLPSSLAHLEIYWCPKLQFVAKTLPVSLAHLYVRGCAGLEFIAETFLDNTRLERITIAYCEKFQFFPQSLHKLTRLNELELYSCPNFISFPEEGLPSTNLRRLVICGCDKLELLPSGIPYLPSLHELVIWNCRSLIFIPDEGFLTNLTWLCVSGVNICRPLVEWGGLHRLTSLKTFMISSGCPEVEVRGMTLPLSLTELRIKDFPNLRCLSSSFFQNLTSLEQLSFENCPKLKRLPKEGLPRSLLVLSISECPLLKNWCKRGKRKDWSKIAHIPFVKIDSKFLYDPDS